MGEPAISSSPRENWIIDVARGLLETPPISPGWSICKVPRNLRSVNKDAYTPDIVSIGPIHHEDKELLPMEDHKRRYLLALFNRTKQPEQMLKYCYDSITRLDEKVRACYAEPIIYDKDKLAKILLHDAGFMLELFVRYYERINLRISQNDPIFTTAWMISTLQRDMVLLENQIPFFVLESLFAYLYQDVAAAERDVAAAERDFVAAERDVAAAERDFVAAEREFYAAERDVAAVERDFVAAVREFYAGERDFTAAQQGLAAAQQGLAAAERDFAAARDFARDVAAARDVADKLDFPLTLKELALQFFKSILNISEEAFRAKCMEKGNHLLHMLYKCYLPSNPIDSTSEEAWEFIHCATSLDQAGVEFQKNTTNGLFDLQFHNGIFKIPQLLIDDSTDSLLRNLVAFEQSQHDSKHYITSYILLMDRLIDTTNDVHLLQQKRIIENKLGGRGDVEYIFNNISKQIVLNDFYFATLCNQVNAYAKSPWHRYKAALRRDYFKNPWSIVSFVAAITLLVLTFLQTLYSPLSYYQKSN